MKRTPLKKLSRAILFAIASTVIACVPSVFAENASDRASPESVRIFYFGNSLTQSSHPDMHAELAEPTGNQWGVEKFFGAGWQTWQHRNELFRAIGRPLDKSVQSLESRGELTLEVKPGESASNKVLRYLEGDWDAILLQIFGGSKDLQTLKMWGNRFDKPVNVGDVVAASDIIHHFLKKNPDGRVFIYTVWPIMDSGKVPPADELPEWARREGARVKGSEFPDRESFNYKKLWSSPYMGDHEKPWTLADYPHWRTRDYTEQVFEGIKENFPGLWESGRLHHLPGGELFYRLDEKMAAGKLPGIATIEDFYTDRQHIRAGAAGYSIAALFYTGIFRDRPDHLDYSIYNQQERYGDDLNHDFGEVIEITPERADVIHDTIWELLREHPQANLNLESQ